MDYLNKCFIWCKQFLKAAPSWIYRVFQIWCKMFVSIFNCFCSSSLLWPSSSKAEIPTLSKILVRFSRKWSITRLFETLCIKPSYNKRTLMNGAIAWRWAGTAKLSRLAARGRQSWLCSFCSISQERFRLEVWNFYHKMQLDGVQLLPSIHFFGTLPVHLEKLKTRIVKNFQWWYLLIFFRKFFQN